MRGFPFLVPLVVALLGARLALGAGAGACPADDEPASIGQRTYDVRSGDFHVPVLEWQPPLARHVASAGVAIAPLPDRGWLAISTSAWRTPGHDPVTDEPPDLFLAGCYRLYRLPLKGERTP